MRQRAPRQVTLSVNFPDSLRSDGLLPVQVKTKTLKSFGTSKADLQPGTRRCPRQPTQLRHLPQYQEVPSFQQLECAPLIPESVTFSITATRRATRSSSNRFTFRSAVSTASRFPSASACDSWTGGAHSADADDFGDIPPMPRQASCAKSIPPAIPRELALTTPEKKLKTLNFLA